MSERTDKSEQIIRIELNSDYAKATVEICNLYGDALMEIVEREPCCQCCAEVKINAQNAVVKAFQMTQAVRAKIKQN